MKEKLTLIQGGKPEQKGEKEKLQEELDKLENNYCSMDSNPPYFICGKNQYGKTIIIGWVEDEVTANRIVKLKRQLDCKVKAKKSDEYERIADQIMEELNND